MNRKNLYTLFSLLMVVAMMLGACAPAAEQATEEPVAPEQPAEPALEPVRRTGYAGRTRCAFNNTDWRLGG